MTLVREKGWGKLLGPTKAILLATEAAMQRESKGRKRRMWNVDVGSDEEDFSDPWSSDDDYADDDDDREEGDEKDGDDSVASWQNALARGTHFEIPVIRDTQSLQRLSRSGRRKEHAAVVSHTTTLRGVQDERAFDEETRERPLSGPNEEPQASVIGSDEVDWNFPATQEDFHRYIVFRDLHRRGLRITAGSKFGADYLVYPGDPSIYHAQFCVRLFHADRRLVPALLASACRGSFQARKHLLIASLEPRDILKAVDEASTENNRIPDIKVFYTTAGPIDGFG